MQLKRDISSQK